MQYITNSTFTINMINTNLGMFGNLDLVTVQDVLVETGYETGIDLDRAVSVEILPSSAKLDKIDVPGPKQKLLSATDKKLLNLGWKNKRSSILITDDKVLRAAAKSNKIRTYTTPQFIAYLVKNGTLTKKNGLEFLEKLQNTYIRPKDIDIVIKRIKKWR